MRGEEHPVGELLRLPWRIELGIEWGGTKLGEMFTRSPALNGADGKLGGVLVVENPAMARDGRS